MADKLPVKHNVFNDLVECPKSKNEQTVALCKKCHNLRIIEEHYVKCNFRIDLERERLFTYHDGKYED